MNINELIELLEDFRDECGEECEVRLMTQQNWPFENHLLGVTETQMMTEEEESGTYCEACDEEWDGVKTCPGCGGPCVSENETEDAQDGRIIYLVEGGQISYGSKAAWENYRSE